jgi:hypothetical protein
VFKDFGSAGPLGINNVVFSQTVGVLCKADALTVSPEPTLRALFY